MSKPKSPAPVPDLPPEIFQLEDLVGDFMQYWGFKKIHGRIWVHLYTAKEPLDTFELLRRLGVSKGLLSLALRELMEHQVIQPEALSENGATTYSANPDLWHVITGVLRKREVPMLGAAFAAAEGLSRVSAKEMAAANLSSERVKSIKTLCQSAKGLLQGFLASDPVMGPALFSALGEAKRDPPRR